MRYLFLAGLLAALQRPGHCVPLEPSEPGAELRASTETAAGPSQGAGQAKPPEESFDSEDLLRQSAVKMAAGDFEASRRLASRAIALDPSSPQARFQRASAALRLKAFEEAVRDASKAIELGYERAAAYNLRSEAYAHQGRFAQALADAERAVNLNTAGPSGYLNRAAAREGLGMPPADILADYKRASELDPQLILSYEAAFVKYGRAKESPRLPGPERRSLGGVLIWAGAVAAALIAGLLYGYSTVWSGRKAKLVRFGSIMEKPPKTDEPRVGAVVGGRFILGRLIESAPERAVYEGRDLEDQPRTLIRHGKRQGLLEKARAMAGLKAPCLAAVDGIFEEADHVWLAYEPIGGDSLRRLLDRLPQRRYSAEQSLRPIKAVCEALELAHDRELLCGPFNPSSIVMDKGQVKIHDFGLCSEASAWDYLSPEEDRGKACRESDLFSAGVCLYEMLTGALPFKGPQAAQDRREGRFPPASSLVQGLPDGIDAFFARALSPDPARRFHAASELLGAFRSLVVPVVQ